MTESRDLSWLFRQIHSELNDFKIELKIMIVVDKETGNTEILNSDDSLAHFLVDRFIEIVEELKKGVKN